MKERLAELIARYFSVGDSYTYNLTRVKEGFAVGTVTLEDFEEFSDDNASDLTDFLVDNGVVLLPCKIGDSAWWIDSERRIHQGKISMIMQKKDGSWKVRMSISFGSYSFAPDKLGKTVFLSYEEAKEAMKKNDQR